MPNIQVQTPDLPELKPPPPKIHLTQEQWEQLEEQEKVLKAQLEAKQKAYDEINNCLGVVLDGLGLTLLSDTQKKLQAQVDKNHEIEAKLKSERAINESLQVGLNSIWLKLTFL